MKAAHRTRALLQCGRAGELEQDLQQLDVRSDSGP